MPNSRIFLRDIVVDGNLETVVIVLGMAMLLLLLVFDDAALEHK